MRQKNHPSPLNSCKKLCYVFFVAVPIILLDGLVMKPAKILFEFLIGALFVTANLAAGIFQCLIVLAVAGVKLVIDLVGELVCTLLYMHYGAAPWPGLSTTFMLSSNECLANMVMAIVLPFNSACQLIAQVFGTIGSACHAMYEGGKLVWDTGAKIFAIFSFSSNNSTTDILTISESDQKPEQSNACRKNGFTSVWGDEKLNGMRDKNIGSTKGQGLPNKYKEEKKITLGYKKTPYMDVRWLYTR